MTKAQSTPDLQIEQLPEGSRLPIELLLEADPDEQRVLGYITYSLILVARSKEQVVGVLAMTPESKEKAEIRNLAVATAMRGKGIARKLVEEASERARRLGYTLLQVSTGNSSIRQFRIYQQFGFELTDVRWNYFVQHYPTTIMEDGIECRHQLVLTKML